MTEFLQSLPSLTEQLATQGWAIHDRFLSTQEATALRVEGDRRRAAGEFHRAGVGRANAQAVRDDIRGDDVLWLDPAQASVAEAAYWQRIEALRAALNEALFLGIRDGEFHYAHYPVGTFYQRHIDRFRDDDKRVISAVCYLNDAWQAADGGALRLWLPPETAPRADEGNDAFGRHLDITPTAGRLVLFRAEQCWHAVQPARRSRWSVTGWMRRG
jgi:SM-20-related protein